MFEKGTLSWKSFLLFTGIIYFLSSQSAFADTYNLYFKKAGPESATVEDSDDIEKDTTAKESADEATAKAKAKAAQEEEQRKEGEKRKAEERAAEEKAAMESQTSKVVIPETGRSQTIIINNNLSAPTRASVEPERVQAPALAPAPPAPVLLPEPTQAPTQTTTQTMEPTQTLEPRRPSPFRMIMSGTVFFGGNDYSFNDPWSSSNSIPGMGLLLTLGIEMLPGLSINAWGGLASSWAAEKFHAGGELEFLPLRINMGSYNLFEIGILAGVSTLNWVPSAVGPAHIGGRANLNFSRNWGVTTSVRVNNSLVMWEGGVIARL